MQQADTTTGYYFSHIDYTKLTGGTLGHEVAISKAVAKLGHCFCSIAWQGMCLNMDGAWSMEHGT